MLSWDLSPKCCHRIQESISRRQDVADETWPLQHLRRSDSKKKNSAGGKKTQGVNRVSSFQFPADTLGIIKESAVWVTPNQTLTTLPTHSAHLLCTLHRQCEYFHFKQAQAYFLKGEGVKKDSGFFLLLSLRAQNSPTSEFLFK